MAKKEKWYPGKHIKGLLGKIKEHSAKFEMGGEYGLKTPEQQFSMQQERAAADPSVSNQRMEKNMGFGLSQHMGKDFDASDYEQVLQLQKAMNAAGIKGADGKVLTKLNTGYHNIKSLITFCDLHDVISICKIKGSNDKINFFGRFKKGFN